METLDLTDTTLGGGHAPIRVCLEVDSALRLGTTHFGVRRSPIRTAPEAAALGPRGHRPARFPARRGLVGVMLYEAQIAGLPDSSPLIRRLTARSASDLANRCRAIVSAVTAIAPLEFVNGGGIGSIEVTTADETVTEVTAGSGLFSPTLFDRYDAFEARPAAFFVLPVVRKPAPGIVTCSPAAKSAPARPEATGNPHRCGRQA